MTHEKAKEVIANRIKERKDLVLAMERLVRSVNDDGLMNVWLMYGVPDGDIKEYTVDEVSDTLVEDDTEFAILMGLFLRIMSRAEKDGGLYAGSVVSREWT